jgi:hypothetical protein
MWKCTRSLVYKRKSNFSKQSTHHRAKLKRSVVKQKKTIVQQRVHLVHIEPLKARHWRGEPSQEGQGHPCMCRDFELHNVT